MSIQLCDYDNMSFDNLIWSWELDIQNMQLGVLVGEIVSLETSKNKSRIDISFVIFDVYIGEAIDLLNFESLGKIDPFCELWVSHDVRPKKSNGISTVSFLNDINSSYSSSTTSK